MSKRNNEQFLNHYIELDKLLCEKFNVKTGGVGEYITRLNSARLAPSRDEVLPRLVRYRNTHRRFYYEPGAMQKDNEITGEDIKWVINFKREVQKKRDPISVYLKKAKSFVFKKKLALAFWIFLIVALLAAIGVIVFMALN